MIEIGQLKCVDKGVGFGGGSKTPENMLTLCKDVSTRTNECFSECFFTLVRKYSASILDSILVQDQDSHKNY